MRDKAAALAAYARQRDDPELDVWMREILLRATIRIGELVRELDKAEPGGAGGGATVQPSGQSKRDAIAGAGISKSSAYDYQELAGGREERGIAAAKAATEAHFAKARAEQKPATMDGLRNAIHPHSRCYFVLATVRRIVLSARGIKRGDSMERWQPMATAPKNGMFVRILAKDGSDIVAFFHLSLNGWKDWQGRSWSAWEDDECHGWEPVDQDWARALPLRGIPQRRRSA